MAAEVPGLLRLWPPWHPSAPGFFPKDILYNSTDSTQRRIVKCVCKFSSIPVLTISRHVLFGEPSRLSGLICSIPVFHHLIKPQCTMAYHVASKYLFSLYFKLFSKSAYTSILLYNSSPSRYIFLLTDLQLSIHRFFIPKP